MRMRPISNIHIKNAEEIQSMRETCALAKSVLQFIRPHVIPGVTTEKLDTLCHDFILEHGAYPSPLNYPGLPTNPRKPKIDKGAFPKSTCTSVNEVICHGIPGPEKLKSGDICNIDVTTTLNGMFGDTNCTFPVGQLDPAVVKLVDVTWQSLWKGIEEVAPGKRFGDIGAAIQEHAEGFGYSVVRDYCGHGIGHRFHEPPQVMHYGVRGTGDRMRAGMTFTIEPMINVGTWQAQTLQDGWTVVTKDRLLTAQFEHTILVTKDGFEVLTHDPENPHWPPAS